MNFLDCWAKQEKKTTVYEINGLKKQYEVNLSFFFISTSVVMYTNSEKNRFASW